MWYILVMWNRFLDSQLYQSGCIVNDPNFPHKFDSVDFSFIRWWYRSEICSFFLSISRSCPWNQLFCSLSLLHHHLFFGSIHCGNVLYKSYTMNILTCYLLLFKSCQNFIMDEIINEFDCTSSWNIPIACIHTDRWKSLLTLSQLSSNHFWLKWIEHVSWSRSFLKNEMKNHIEFYNKNHKEKCFLINFIQ